MVPGSLLASFLWPSIGRFEAVAKTSAVGSYRSERLPSVEQYSAVSCQLRVDSKVSRRWAIDCFVVVGPSEELSQPIPVCDEVDRRPADIRFDLRL